MLLADLDEHILTNIFYLWLLCHSKYTPKFEREKYILAKQLEIRNYHEVIIILAGVAVSFLNTNLSILYGHVLRR
jgi:hypothetical protein